MNGRLLLNYSIRRNLMHHISECLDVMLTYMFISPEQQPDKLSSKSEEMTFIGYEPNTKGWHFWSETKHWVVVANNATFDENFFPHCSRHQEDGLAPISIEDHDPTIGESNELPPLNNDSQPQATEPNWDVYVPIPISCGNTPDFGDANPALDQEPWFPPMSPQRPQSPLGFNSPACPPSYRTDFSPLHPGIWCDQPETGHRSDIEDWHQYKRYMLTDSPPASLSSEEEDWLVKPISQSWFPPRQQSRELLHEAYKDSLLLGRQLLGDAHEETNVQSATFQRDLRHKVKQLAFKGLRMTQGMRLGICLYCINWEWGIQTVTIEFIYAGPVHMDQEKKEERGKE